MSIIPSRPIKFFGTFVIILTILTICTAITIPIYIDEIGWKMQDGRILLDGMEAPGLEPPTCGRVWTSVPWPFVPYRILDSLLYQGIANPLWIRLASVTIAVLLVGAIAFELTRALAGSVRANAVVVATIAFATLGVLPFLLALSRPEQLLLLVTAVLVLRTYSRTDDPANTIWKDWAISLGVGVLGSLLIASHPKAIFFIPVFLMAGLAAARRWAPRVVAIGVTTLTAAYAFPFWIDRLSCPGDPLMRAGIDQRSLVMAIKNGAIGEYLERFVQNPINYTYVRKIVQKNVYMSWWLPSDEKHFIFRDAISYSIVVILFVFFFLGLISYIGNLALGDRKILSRRPTITLGLLWLSLIGLSLSQGIKGDYEGTLMVPLFAIASALSFFEFRVHLVQLLGRRKSRLALRVSFLGLLILSVLSQSLLLVTFSKNIPTWVSGGYLAEQRLSLSAFRYSRIREQILMAAAQCGIDPKHNLHRLAVDQVTYFAFSQTFRPTYVVPRDFGDWTQRVTDLAAFLKSLGSEGLVVGCESIPASLTSGVIATGQFCCHASFAGDSQDSK